MPDHSMMKLGRKAIKTDSRTLRMVRYLTAALPAPPLACDWTKGIKNFGMMLNDKLGDCTIAGCGHAIQVWSANTGSEITLFDSTVESYYEQWDGYNPNDPETDQGGIELDVLNNWRKLGLAGHALLAYADPSSPSNLEEVRQAINLFGGVYIGLSLPLTAQHQDVWDVKGGSNARAGSWGGHCVYVPQYDAKSFTCITWGGLKTMTVAFWNKYCDEAHALLGQDWINSMGVDPQGFNLAQLQADLAAIK